MHKKKKQDTERMNIFAMDDLGAKKIFQAEIVRRNFVNAILGIPIEAIRSTRLLNTHILKRFRRDKEGILDIVIELNDDTTIMIEIQVEPYKYWDRRSFYYLTKNFQKDFILEKNIVS